MSLGIGSKVWCRNHNHRVYIKGQSGPTERGYWSECTVIGESPRMWILEGHVGKIPKNGKLPAGIATSTIEVDRAVWVAENQYRIVHAVERLHWGVVKDTGSAFEKLKQIAEIVGYSPAAP